MHAEDRQPAEKCNITVKAFTFREMAIATRNFRQECVIFDDGFGKVFKGTLKPSGEVCDTSTCTLIGLLVFL